MSFWCAFFSYNFTKRTVYLFRISFFSVDKFFGDFKISFVLCQYFFVFLLVLTIGECKTNVCFLETQIKDYRMQHTLCSKCFSKNKVEIKRDQKCIHGKLNENILKHTHTYTHTGYYKRPS